MGIEEQEAGRELLGEQDGEVLLEFARMTIAEKLGVAVDEDRLAWIRNYLDQERFSRRRGIFVSLHIRGQLRGCIGSLEADGAIRSGVREHALNAGFHDPRFSPLTREELADSEIEVSILTKPIPVEYDDPRELLTSLVPGVDGVVLRKGRAGATFLPQVWEQLPDPEMFMGHLCLKAGLSAREWERGTLSIERYQVLSFQEAAGSRCCP